MNNDRLIDIVVGDRSGKVFFYSRNENGTLHSEGPFEGVQVNYNSSPAVTDWNGDGLLDVLVGSQGISPTYGVVYYYLNNGTPEQPVMSGGGAILDETNNWIYHYRAQPQVFDLDSDGIKELIIGEADGNFYFHENIGTNSAPIIIQGTSLGIQLNMDCRLSITDWNEDGIWDIVAGDYGQNLFLFLGNNGGVDNLKSDHNTFAMNNISYKPTLNKIQFDIKNMNASEIELSLFTSNGKLISTVKMTGNITTNNISIERPSYHGIAFAKIKVDGQLFIKKISLL